LNFFPSNKWQYNLLSFLAGAKKRFAFHYHLKRITSLSMLNNDLFPVDPQLHDVRQNITLVAHFLQKDLSSAPITFPTLYTSTDPSNAIDQLPQNSNGYLAIHPGSSAEHGMDAKRWPAERFGYLADRICSELHCTALLFGGSDETDLKQQTASVMQQPSVIIPPVSLPQTAALLSKCHCCLCNDSGIMHLAAACHLPTIALFGPTDERRNGPFGDNHCIIRKAMAGFPLWTAANVGTRLLPAGIDPRRSLMELSVEEAWKQCKDFIQQFKTD
jgi:heptosyltransferase-2